MYKQLQFLEILQEFGREEQRAFIQFTTGAPQLPLGGLASLDPKLTVVQKVWNLFSIASYPNLSNENLHEHASCSTAM
jgi:hypothetical protein